MSRRTPALVPSRRCAGLLFLALCACSTQAGGRSLGAPPPTLASAPHAPLTGGETDDNARLPEYLAYVEAYPHGDVPKLDLTGRRVLTLVDDARRPLWDVDVSVKDATQRGVGAVYAARTNAAGHFLLPAAALNLPPGASLEVHVGGAGGSVPVPNQGDEVVVPGSVRRDPHASGVNVDVALVVDTTGSMADEVARLRATLRSVVARLVTHSTAPRVRVGGVAYRDAGEEYVTRPFDFTSDLGAVQRTLDGLSARGGGDVPEAVQEALDVAVRGLSWGGPGTVRMLFLIGDAPPHFASGRPYTQTMRDAVERGITIVPVAASGIDDTGEFVFRQLAAVTLGRFLFVTYGGATGNHVGTYEENDLDLLMLRAVWEALDDVHGVRSPSPSTLLATPRGLEMVPMEAKHRLGQGRSPWEFGIPGWPGR